MRMGKYTVSAYCMTGRAIRENIPFQIDRISPTIGRDDTEVEMEYFPVLPDPRNCNTRFIMTSASL